MSDKPALANSDTGDINDEIRRSLDLVRRTAEEHRTNVASILMDAGIVLLPCDALRDNQFMVSAAIYKASLALGDNR